MVGYGGYFHSKNEFGSRSDGSGRYFHSNDERSAGMTSARAVERGHTQGPVTSFTHQ